MICSTFIRSFPVIRYILTIHCQHWIRCGLTHFKMMAGVFSEYLQEFLFLNFRILKGAVVVWYLVSDVCNYVNRIQYTLKSDLKFCAILARIAARYAGNFYWALCNSEWIFLCNYCDNRNDCEYCCCTDFYHFLIDASVTA